MNERMRAFYEAVSADSALQAELKAVIEGVDLEDAEEAEARQAMAEPSLHSRPHTTSTSRRGTSSTQTRTPRRASSPMTSSRSSQAASAAAS